MNALLGRLAAIIATAIVMFLLNLIGLEVSPEQRQGIINWLTEGLTALGTFLGLALYASFHKLINSRLAPEDKASETPLLPPRGRLL